MTSEQAVNNTLRIMLCLDNGLVIVVNNRVRQNKT